MPDKFDLALEIAQTHPNAVARYLESYSAVAASTFIDAVPDKLSSNILQTMLPYHAAKCLENMSADAAAKYLSALELRTMVSILRHMREANRNQIIVALPRQLSARASILMRYPLSVIGAWLNPTILTLPADCSAADAKARLSREGYVDFHRVYVVDTEQHLVGTFRLSQLLTIDDARHLRDFLDPAPSPLRANLSLEAALESPGWSENDFLPVVDRQDRVIGILRYADLRAAIMKPQARKTDERGSDTLMDLAETCYLGLADVMNTSLSIRHSNSNEEIGT